MEDSDSDACLPPGWTVKVNVRKNGKKDKYYFPPSSNRKFNSIVGVFRYLNDAKNKANIQRVTNNLPDIESYQQIPRRASKRLAGIKADPLLELKPTRVCRDLTKISGEDKAVINADRSTNGLPNDSLDVAKQSSEDKVVINTDRSTSSLPNDQMKQLNTVEGSETMFIVKSAENTMENHATKKECEKMLEKGDNFDGKLDYTTVSGFPLNEILNDPCIAFAIHTLTGNTFETLKVAQTSASADERGKKINATGDDSMDDGQNVLSSPKNFAIAEKLATVADKNEGSCSEKKRDISKMALSNVNLCKSDYNCSQMFGKERRNVC